MTPYPSFEIVADFSVAFFISIDVPVLANVPSPVVKPPALVIIAAHPLIVPPSIDTVCFSLRTLTP